MRSFHVLLLLLPVLRAAGQTDHAFRDPALPTADRVNDLIGQLTLDEKIALLSYDSPGVERLGIPAYNWWNEALHGVARAGRATVFPQAIGMAATFDPTLIREVGTAIGDEARAKYNAALRNKDRGQYHGLTFWSPNVNIFRDPRWGRGHETYGEDPFLTGSIGAAYVKGVQGDDMHYLKAVACAKHFAVHSGPEPQRHEFDAVVSETDLRTTYLPAFHTLVDAGVGGIMCAYNRINGDACCGNSLLMNEILRKEWGFTGYVVTDCWALDDIMRFHKAVDTEVEAAALGVHAGVNIECGTTLKVLRSAVEQGAVTEAEIDASLRPNLSTLLKLGFFDPAGKVPFDTIPEDVIDGDAHRHLARKVATKSIVLLSNKQNTLPLSPSIKSLLVTGPNADDHAVLLANYNGLSSHLVTVLEGVTNAVSASTAIMHNTGCSLTDTTRMDVHWQIEHAEAIIAVLGLSPLLEGENGDAYLSDAGGDRASIAMPYAQLKYLRALRKRTSKPLVVVIMAGSAIDLREVEQLADAVVLAWYPGEEGGNAVADVLFGKANPSGKLPITFYASDADLPPFADYSMQGRTYRYFRGKPLHAFGYGLSYTSFSYEEIGVETRGGGYSFSMFLKNTGMIDGDEVVQLYVARRAVTEAEPLKQLKAFKRVHLPKGASVHVQLHITREDLATWDERSHNWVVRPGEYEITIGGSSEDRRAVHTITVER